MLAGLTLPDLAAVIKEWLPLLVSALLCVAAIRIGAKAALGSLGDLGHVTRVILIQQLALPVAGLVFVLTTGLADHPLSLAVLLMLSAPSISGAANFTALMGHDPAIPMRLLILGTALFPLTALPVLWLIPGLGNASDVILAAARLAGVITISVGIGFVLRKLVLPQPTARHIAALDGAGAILLAVMVVGLMAALGPALRATPAVVAYWLIAVLTINLGLQVAAFRLGASPGTSIVTGNRNVALYLVALPPATVDPLLIFIGCYQIPMYLTPILMARLYRKTA